MNLQYLEFSRISLNDELFLRPYELCGDDTDVVHRKNKTTLDSYKDMFFGHEDITSLFEIGVADGGSLILWNLVFGCKVVGIDNRFEVSYALSEYFHSHDISVYYMDSLCIDAVEQCINIEFPNGVDVIIDDGAHTIETITASILSLFKFVKSGGLYIIEDWKALHPIHQEVLFDSILEHGHTSITMYKNFLVLRKQ